MEQFLPVDHAGLTLQVQHSPSCAQTIDRFQPILGLVHGWIVRAVIHLIVYLAIGF
jgi:hypothetical protein